VDIGGGTVKYRYDSTSPQGFLAQSHVKGALINVLELRAASTFMANGVGGSSFF
jgi:hypothetical protein